MFVCCVDLSVRLFFFGKIKYRVINKYARQGAPHQARLLLTPRVNKHSSRLFFFFFYHLPSVRGGSSAVNMYISYIHNTAAAVLLCSIYIKYKIIVYIYLLVGVYDEAV